MKKTWKKTLSVFLTLSMVTALVPATAWADEGIEGIESTQENDIDEILGEQKTEMTETPGEDQQQEPVVDKKGAGDQETPAEDTGDAEVTTPTEKPIEEEPTLPPTNPVEEEPKEEEPVAMLFSTRAANMPVNSEYGSIAEALKKEDITEIKLTDNLTEDVTIEADKNITLDLNGNTLTGRVVVKGKLTIKDETAKSDPVVSDDYKTVTYESGKITTTADAVVPAEGGIVILESGTIESTVNCGVYALGNQTPKGTGDEFAVNSTFTMNGGYVVAQESGVMAAGRGATLNINGGVIFTKDNAVVGGNGTDGTDRYDGGTEINISGGTMIGHIKTNGYIACGIYHPQAGKLNITGGTIYADGGVGVLMRGGTMNMTGGEIIATGTDEGWVGDKKFNIGSYGVLVDDNANYPGGKTELNAEIKDGSVTSDKGAVSLLEGGADVNGQIVVSGGEYSDSVDPEYLAPDFKYETQNNDNMYTYHKTIQDAQAAGSEVKQVKDDSGNAVGADAEKVTVIIKPNNGKDDTTLTVLKNATIEADDLGTPVKSRYKFRGWKIDGNAITFPYKVEADVTIEASWKKKSSSSSSSSSSSDEKTYAVSKADVENGKVKIDPAKAEKGDKVTITVTPDKGYEIGKVRVTDADGNKIDLKDKGKGEYTFTMPASKVEVKATFTKAEEKPVEPEDKTIVLTINQLAVSVFGETKINDVAPIIRNDRTMLPIRVVAEALGAKVAWDNSLKQVTITKDDLTIEIFIGSPFAKVNGTPVQLDSPAFIENSRTYLPIRFVAENLGADVAWDQATQQVTITPDK